MKFITSVLLFLFVAQANAEVLNSAANGFQIKLTRNVAVPANVAYQQFIRIDQWWHNDHTWFGDASKLYIEAKANGCFCEVNGEQQAQHMTVTYVLANQEIRMTGGLGPLQMLGVQGGMAWRFIALADNQTQIELSYHVTGYMDGGLDKLANIVDKVQSEQLDNLVNKLTLAVH